MLDLFSIIVLSLAARAVSPLSDRDAVRRSPDKSQVSPLQPRQKPQLPEGILRGRLACGLGGNTESISLEMSLPGPAAMFRRVKSAPD